MTSTILLAVHCKKGESLDLRKAVNTYVAGTYGVQAAEEAGDDMQEIQSLRDDIVNLSGSLQHLRRTLSKYYRMLALMESRFPLSRSREGVNLTFSWADAFKPSKRAEQASLDFERAAILFNLGAVASQQGLACERRSEAGLRESARVFQEAAGYFAALREGPCLRIERPAPMDLTPEAADMLCHMMLAQAQECVFEKAAADRKSPALLARLSKQVSSYYDDCSRLLTSAPLTSHFDKSWVAHAGVKSMLYDVEAIVQSSAALAAADPLAGVAQEIARLKAAQIVLARARKDAKATSKELQENVAAKESQVAQRLAKAERENATVYLQRVPAEADLPPIAPASLVKPVAPADLEAVDDEVRNLFSSVIPDASAKALSRYTEMVDIVIRKATEALDAASDEARLRLREWDLPEALQALEAGSVAALPDAVRSELEDVERSGGLKHLQEVAQQVKEVRRVAVEELQAVARDLANEEADDEQLRAHHGSRWNRAPSSQLTRGLRDRVAGYQSNLAVAGESDSRLERRLAGESAAFAALGIEAAAAEMPRLQAPMLSVDNMGPAAAVTTLRTALEGLDTLSAQRASLEEGLKERKQRDNVLPKLLAAPRDAEALFREEIKKYDDLVDEVDANVAKQGQLLAAIRPALATYKADYGYEDWKRACNSAAAGIRQQCARFKELQDNLAEGLRFYMSLQEAIAQLRQHVGDHILTRRMQRDEMVEELRRVAESQRLSNQMSTMQLGPQPPPPPPSQQHQGSQGQYPSGPYHQQYPSSNPYTGQQTQQQQGYQQGGGPAGPYPSFGPLSSNPPPSQGGGYSAPTPPSDWQSQGPQQQQQYNTYGGGSGAPSTQQQQDQPPPSYGNPMQGTGGHVQNLGTYLSDVFRK
ncbi:HLM1 [Auxenochlorella protothecoides x Auxenochlorella symbiontica]